MHTNPSSRPIVARRFISSRRAFTLTELLVAVGIVAVLTLGIGQLFNSTQSLVNTGAATAEIDQLARAIEQQLRDDFDALNRMAADETFIAIRMREIGDTSRDGVVDNDEVALYLSPDDRDFDRQNRISPYDADPSGRLQSRAVTRRVDELMFLAPSSTGSLHYTVQTNSRKGEVDEDEEAQLRREANPPGELYARIYYGHSLRPVPDRNWPPDDFGEEGSQRSPRRFFFPDGDFGEGPNQPIARRTDNRFAINLNPGSPIPDESAGLNEHAGDWILTRQPLILYGGLAAGYPPNSGRAAEAPIGRGREYAMFIRDLEAIHRAPTVQDLGYDLFEVLVDYDVDGSSDLIENVYDERFPEPRLIQWGRTDLCAQSLDDVRRWLEGERAGYNPGAPTTALPFTQGRFSDPMTAEGDSSPGNNPADVNRFLWQRVDSNNGPSNPAQRQRINRQRLQNAIAGCFIRPQQDTEAPTIDRVPEIEEIQPDDRLMDLHAVLTSNCSNFEIAWSDGAIAPFDSDLDGDISNGFEVRKGDMIWYDISPVDPDDPNSPRRTLRWWVEDSDFADEPGVFSFSADDTSPTSAEDALWPEIDFDGRAREIGAGTEWGGALETDDGRTFAPFQSGGSWTVPYNVDITGGAPEEDDEYLAIWPFRVPNANGEYEGPWPKDIFIRVRLTLHDSQLRAEKDFEFIFRVQPQGV